MAIRNSHAAGLSRAAAIRALHSYRAARNRAEDRGADLALLVEAPDFHVLGATYLDVIEEFIEQRIDCVSTARSALDLLAQITTDQQLTGILDEGGPVSDEKDRFDSLRLIDRLSGWVNDVDIAEAIAEERLRAVTGEPTPPLCKAGNAELRRRAEAIVAEFGGPLPEATEAGFAEAERRLAGLRQAHSALGKALPYDLRAENEIIIPTLNAAENALVAFIEDAEPPRLAAAAIKLRELLVDASEHPGDALRQVLAVVERAASDALGCSPQTRALAAKAGGAA
jgi:hypothetical protein